MKNDYKIRGSVTVIYLKRRTGEVLEAIIDTEELDRLLQIDCKWYAKPTRKQGVYYVINKHYQYLHRVITNAPKGLVVDHINHDTLNNTKRNLRVVTNRENILNTPVRNKYRKLEISNGGVSWHKRDKKWMVRVRKNGKRKWLGSFECKEKALQHLKEYSNKIFG